MIFDLVLTALAVAGIAALWRNFRYDTENPANKYLDALPYLLKKPITCGICFTFWVAGVFTILFVPLEGWLPPERFLLPATAEMVVTFLISWMILGTVSALALYILDTFFEVSHYYKHRAHDHHDHQNHQ